MNINRKEATSFVLRSKTSCFGNDGQWSLPRAQRLGRRMIRKQRRFQVIEKES